MKYFEKEYNKQITPVNNEIQGIYVDYIDLIPTTYSTEMVLHNKQMRKELLDKIRKEIATNIAGDLLYDIKLLEPPEVKYPIIRASSVIYTKPNEIQLNKELQNERRLSNELRRELNEIQIKFISIKYTFIHLFELIKMKIRNKFKNKEK